MKPFAMIVVSAAISHVTLGCTGEYPEPIKAIDRIEIDVELRIDAIDVIDDSRIEPASRVDLIRESETEDAADTERVDVDPDEPNLQRFVGPCSIETNVQGVPQTFESIDYAGERVAENMIRIKASPKTDVEFRKRTFIYDDNGRLSRIEEHETGATTTIDYRNAADLKSTTETSNQNQIRKDVFIYEEGRLRSIATVTGDATYEHTTLHYAEGPTRRLNSWTNAVNFALSPSLGVVASDAPQRIDGRNGLLYQTTFTYGDNGLVQSSATRFAVDEALEMTERFEFDVHGNLLSQTNSQGTTMTYTYDCWRE